MRRARTLGLGALAVSLAAASACGGSGTDSKEVVTEAVRYQEVDSTVVAGDLEASAIDYVRGLSSALELGLSANDDYSVTSVVTTPGIRHARMQQTYAGVPVFGAELVVHADDTTFLGFNGFVTKNLDGFDVTTALSEDQAFAAATAHLGDGAAVEYQNEVSKLVILPREGGKGADLAWHLEFFTDPQPGVELGRWNYFVDARSGDILKSFNGLTTLEQASGPGGNARVSRTWDAKLDVETGGDGYLMDTARIVTYDLENETYRPNQAATAASLDFPDPAVNDAHGFTEITLDMLRDWMGRNSLDDNGFVIVNRVHYGVDVDSAFWDGRHVTFGDSNPEVRFPRSGALDIVAHEMGHGFTEFHSGLIYSDQSGALNESFSDVTGTLAEFYLESMSADWLIGEDIYVEAGGTHRYMCDPTADGYSIGHARDYERSHRVHSSSGVANRAFCLAVSRFMASSSGGDMVDSVRQVGNIWFTANAAYWTSGATYIEGCRGTIDAARALGYDGEVVEALAQSWADVGVECDSSAFVCNADGSCDVGAGETCASCAEDCGACSEDCGWFKKVKCKIGIGDCSRCDAPPGCGDGLCNGDETDVTCAKDCGCEASACGDLAPFGCYCDPTCELYGDCCADYGTCNE